MGLLPSSGSALVSGTLLGCCSGLRSGISRYVSNCTVVVIALFACSDEFARLRSSRRPSISCDATVFNGRSTLKDVLIPSMDVPQAVFGGQKFVRVLLNASVRICIEFERLAWRSLELKATTARKCISE